MVWKLLKGAAAGLGEMVGSMVSSSDDSLSDEEQRVYDFMLTGLDDSDRKESVLAHARYVAQHVAHREDVQELIADTNRYRLDLASRLSSVEVAPGGGEGTDPGVIEAKRMEDAQTIQQISSGQFLVTYLIERALADDSSQLRANMTLGIIRAGKDGDERYGRLEFKGNGEIGLTYLGKVVASNHDLPENAWAEPCLAHYSLIAGRPDELQSSEPTREHLLSARYQGITNGPIPRVFIVEDRRNQPLTEQTAADSYDVSNQRFGVDVFDNENRSVDVGVQNYVKIGELPHSL